VSDFFDFPVDRQIELVLQSEPKIRYEFAGSCDIPEILEALARDEITRIRRNVAGNSKTPPHVLISLAADPQASVRYQIATNLKTPLSALDILSGDTDEDVRSALCWNWNRLSLQNILTLFEDSQPRVKEAISRYVSIYLSSQELLWELAHNENLQIQSCVAKNTKCDSRTYDFLLDLGHRKVLGQLASNIKLSDESLFKLSRHEWFGIREAVAENPSTSTFTLSILAHDHLEGIRVQVAKRILELETYKILAADKLASVRAKIAQNADAPVEILRMLSLDTSVQVKKAILNNRNPSQEVTEIINSLKSAL
jgi:hypothetical protein